MDNLLRGLNLYLIGMMGSGKSTVGKVLADQLGYRFFDTDTLVEQIAKQSVSQIFAEVGEAEFRQLEGQVLRELSAYTRLVIATGGGIILKQDNWSALRHGVIVWLKVPVEQLYQRLQTDTTRPLLQDPNPQAKLQSLLEQRQSLYAQADVQVEHIPGESPEQLAQRILEQVKQVIQPPVVPPRAVAEQN